MSLYSDGIIFKFRFQKSHFMTKNGKGAAIFSSLCIQDASMSIGTQNAIFL